MNPSHRVRSQATRVPQTAPDLPQIVIELHRPKTEHDQQIQVSQIEASSVEGPVFIDVVSVWATEESNDTLSSQIIYQDGQTPQRLERWKGAVRFLAGAVVVAVLLAGSWYGLPIQEVEIVGNNNLEVSEVKKLIGMTPGFGWLYYGAWRAKGALKSPWIESVKLTRVFPNKVHVLVKEYVPFVRYQPVKGKEQVFSENGQSLPMTSDSTGLPLVKGWGPDRVNDAILIVRAMRHYNIKTVEFTPSGLTVHTADAAVWSGDLKSLMKYAGSIGMYPNKQIHIYPWGVSVQQ